MQYEVIMTDIGHTMQRDGEYIVFGDVMFGLPNNGRSRISSFGEGPDKLSARQSLIDRAIDYLVEEEQLYAEEFGAEYVFTKNITIEANDEDEAYEELGDIVSNINDWDIVDIRDAEDFRAEEKKSKKKPSKSAAPVEVVNSRSGFFDDEQDKEYFGFGFIVGGIIVGVLGTIFGNIFSELVLDEMRVNKFGYRDSSQTESSFWQLGS